MAENQNVEWKESWRDDGYVALQMLKAGRYILERKMTVLLLE